jgi:hypothetical protein
LMQKPPLLSWNGDRERIEPPRNEQFRYWA